MHGYSITEMQHMGLKDLDTPQSFQQVSERMKRLKDGERLTFEVEHYHKDGHVFPLEVSASLITIDGESCIQCFHRDITERKQLEEAQTFLSHCGLPGSGEDFFESLAKYLAQSLAMEYVCIDRLEGDGLTAQTVAIYNSGAYEPNVRYALKDTPCGDVVGKTICCFPRDASRLFPKDAALQDLKAESYIGTTLWSFVGKPIGLIAVIGQKPIGNRSLAESVLKLVSIRAAGELERKQAEAESLQLREKAEISSRL
ncbi:MAG: PAS domain S-box protein, partial [Deltaproteobacteria bacterium]